MKLPKCMQMLPSSRRSVCGGGLADELLEILSSDLASVDDWIMEKNCPFGTVKIVPFASVPLGEETLAAACVVLAGCILSAWAMGWV